MTDYMILVGERLREAREAIEPELPQRVLAEHLRLSTPEGYGHYERGQREMSLWQLVKFCEITGVLPHWVLTGEQPKYPEKPLSKIDLALETKISKLSSEKKQLLLNVAEGLEKDEKRIDDKDA